MICSLILWKFCNYHMYFVIRYFKKYVLVLKILIKTYLISLLDPFGSASFVVLDTDYDNYALVCTCQSKKFLFEVLTFHRRSCTILQRSSEHDASIARKVIFARLHIPRIIYSPNCYVIKSYLEETWVQYHIHTMSISLFFQTISSKVA